MAFALVNLVKAAAPATRKFGLFAMGLRRSFWAQAGAGKPGGAARAGQRPRKHGHRAAPGDGAPESPSLKRRCMRSQLSKYLRVLRGVRQHKPAGLRRHRAHTQRERRHGQAVVAVH